MAGSLEFGLSNHRVTLSTVITTAALATIAGRLAYNIFRTTKQTPIIYKAPRRSEHRSENNTTDHPYPSDALPGVRDVDTPYGSIRVNEWGPTDGRKVLFIHGISTPSIACAHMALKLADEDGCRVMMFDLFGRGYSDTTDPFQVRQDIRLFTSQILLVIASSSVAWTGAGNSFTLVGYSLGGGIASSFASYFPQLIDTLVLIAPAGLMRASRIHLSSRLIYGGFLPDLLRDYLVKRRIVGPAPSKKSSASRALPNDNHSSSDDLDDAERGSDNPEFAPGSTAPLFPNSTASAAASVAWQVFEHEGFLKAFISSIKFAPISNEHERWRLIGSRLTAQKQGKASAEIRAQGLEQGKVLLMFGKSDGVVAPEETATDARAALGEDNVQVEMLDGGHDVPITNSQACIEKIREFWSVRC